VNDAQVHIELAEPPAAADEGRHAAVGEPRGFALKRGEPLPAGLRRIAQGQFDLTIELLVPAHGGLSEEAVHETRKALKRLRALARLLRDELGPEVYARENETLRDAMRRLAGARDAEVMVATLDALCAQHGRELAGYDLRALRDELDADRAAAVAQTAADAGTAEEVRAALRAARARVAHWKFKHDDFTAVAPGLERIYRQGRRHYRTARAEATSEHLHEWRKYVKYLRHAAEILVPAEPKLLKSVAARADHLGEALGDEHDLAVLAEIVAARGTALVGRRSSVELLALIELRRARLRRQALQMGKRLYTQKPAAFVRPIARGWRRRAAPG
jgi:CHAD domain-containing protein